MRIFIAMLLTTCLLGACSSAPVAELATVAPAQANTAVTAPATNVPATDAPATQVPATMAPTAAQATATVVPTSAPVAATDAPTVAPTSALSTDLPTATTQPATALAVAPGKREGEILFLRKADLVAYNVDTRSERTVAQGVRDFTATPDGRLIALVRGKGLQAELWIANRDGSGLRQLTRNNRAEGTLAFAPDGLTLAFSSAQADLIPGLDWPSWSRWSRQSEVRLLNIATGQELLLGKGTDPTFSPDGRRVAYATAPNSISPDSSPDLPLGMGNAIRIVNRQGQNSWNFATAGNVAQPTSGLLVYAPVFSPNGSQLAYKRYAGVQVEVDIVYTELGNSFQGKGVRIGTDSGWLPPRFAPDSTLVAVSDNFAEGQRGWGGYEQWSASVLRPGGTSSIAMPEGQIELAAAQIDHLVRAQRTVWSPSAGTLAVQLPAGWQATAPKDQATYTEETAGELWRWIPGSAPSERLASGVDFGSPLLWLPPAHSVQRSAQGYHLAYPSGWQLAAATEFEEITANGPDGIATLSAAPTADASVDSAFPTLVAQGAKEEAAIAWPDGSSYREWSGTSPEGAPVAGALRSVSRNGSTVLIIYRTTPERWPEERAQALGLLAASGQSQ